MKPKRDIVYLAGLLALIARSGRGNDVPETWITEVVSNHGYSVAYPSSWNRDERTLAFASFAASSPKTENSRPMSIAINRETSREWTSITQLVDSARTLITHPSPADHQRYLSARVIAHPSGYDGALIEIGSADTNAQLRITQLYLDTRDGGYLNVQGFPPSPRTESSEKLLLEIFNSIRLRESSNKGVEIIGNPLRDPPNATP